MAPDDTSTVWPRCPARTSTSASTRDRSSPPAAVVSDDEPTLTTIRLAVVTCGRTRPFWRPAFPPPPPDPISWPDMRDEYVEAVLEVVERIPPGRVMSYGAIAEYLGEGGPRPVGTVMSHHGGPGAGDRRGAPGGRPAPGPRGRGPPRGRPAGRAPYPGEGGAPNRGHHVGAVEEDVHEYGHQSGRDPHPARRARRHDQVAAVVHDDERAHHRRHPAPGRQVG